MSPQIAAYGECPECRNPRIILAPGPRLAPHGADGLPCPGQGALPAVFDLSKPCTCTWTKLPPSGNDLGEPRRTYPDAACPRHRSAASEGTVQASLNVEEQS